MYFIALQFLCVLRFVSGDEDPLLVHTEQGSLVGTEVENEVNQETYYAFYSIPYAQPPIKEKRFLEPMEPLPWEGIFNATEEGDSCLSVDPIFQAIRGDEDCLTLSVYTPKPPSQLAGSPLPVMVWIHGGAFHQASGGSLYYGPDYFMMAGNVIIVSINYRVNVFGFLSLQNEEVPGNAGLKDQIMGLKWVRANVKFFGGDPERVTIFGESAGGASVHYLFLARQAKGLFQRAIIQSGTVLSPWASTNLTVSSALKLGKVFACDTEDLKALVECLRKVDAEELVKYQYNVVAPTLSEPLALKIFLPCVEPIKSKDPILTKDPRVVLNEGPVIDVPLIIGTVEMEMLILYKGGILPRKLVNAVYSAANKNPALLLGFKVDEIEPSLRKKVAEQVKKFYFGDSPFSDETIVNLINATTDINFLLGTLEAIDYHLARGISPIYQYHFTIDTEFGRIKQMLNIPIKGPSHGDDITYLFYSQMSPPSNDLESAGYKAMLKIIKLWTNFATHGTPTPDVELNVTWKPVSTKTRYYLEIGEELTLKENIEKERVEFWDLMSRENIHYI